VFLLLGGPTLLVADSQKPDLSAFENAKIDWKQKAGDRLLVAMNTHWWTDALEKKLPEFEALTGIKVTLDVYPEEEFRKKRVITMASGSGIFDVMMMDQALAQYAEAGWLQPLMPFVDNPKLTDKTWYDLDDVFAKARDFGTYKSVFYGIPITGEAEILFYRTDLFKKSGIAVPQTMDELYNAAKKLKSQGVSGIVLRGQRGSGANVWPWTGFLFTYGGRFFDAKDNPIFNSPEGIAATEMYVKLLKDAGPMGAANYNWYECSSDFQQGKTAMFIDSSGFMPLFVDPEKSAVAKNVGYAMMPKVPGKDLLPNFWYWMIAMAANSDHKDAGWLFMQWATSKAASLDIALGGGSSGRASVWASPSFKAKYPAQWADVTSKTLAIADPTLVPYNKKQFPEFGEVLSIAITDAISGTRDIGTGLTDAANETVKILSH
jgi:multiple sugar transport system substrate-binding protein